MMRKGIHADSRMEWRELFFDRSFDRPLPENAPCRDALEMVRRAPSAVNRQPWRVVCSENAFHFYEKRDREYAGEKTGDLQKIDVGIALCHLVSGLEELGETPETVTADPGLRVPEGVEYIATVRRK